MHKPVNFSKCSDKEFFNMFFNTVESQYAELMEAVAALNGTNKASRHHYEQVIAEAKKRVYPLTN